MNTAKDRVVFFDSMTNDVCATIRASWCEGMDCTFEAIECVGAAIHGYLERLVVIVPASFAYWHGRLYSTEIDLVLIFHPKKRFLPTGNLYSKPDAYAFDCNKPNGLLSNDTGR